MRGFRQIWSPFRTNFVKVQSTCNYFVFWGSYLLGVGLKFSGAYHMVRAAVGRGVCLLVPLWSPTLPWLSGLVTLFTPSPIACTEESSAPSLPTHVSLCTIHTQSLDQLRPWALPQLSVPLLWVPDDSSILRGPSQVNCGEGECCLVHVFPTVLTPWRAGIAIRQVCC